MPGEPGPSLLQDVGALLLFRMRGLFLKSDPVAVEETPDDGGGETLAAVRDQPLPYFQQRQVRLAPIEPEQIIAMDLNSLQDAAYDSLLRSRRQAMHRRAAEILRDDPERAAAEPELIAHHFTEAGLDDLAIEWWGKAGDQALRRSAFQEAIAHLGNAIAMADKTEGGKEPGAAGQRRQLQIAYGNALIAARGFGAQEAKEAFATARELADGDEISPERLAADYGLFIGSLSRGELASARSHTAAFLRDVEGRPDSPEAGVAHRVTGMMHWFAGEFERAREHLEQALALFQPGRDDGLTFRFGSDAGVQAMLYLAFALWQLGEIDRSVSLVSDANARIPGVAHAAASATGIGHVVIFELTRGNLEQAAPNVSELVRMASDYDLAFWRPYGVFLEGCVKAGRGAQAEGLDEMRRGLGLLREHNTATFVPLLKLALARAEARAGDLGRALAALDEGLAESERTSHRAFDAELYRARGETLLEREPSDPAPAEEAFQTAIAMAKEQGARSFSLRAALSLARLYQSTGRLVEAHAVLAPALEGFSPTPEMPEIAEAQELKERLA